MPNKRKNQKFDDSNSTDSTPLGALPLTTDQLVELANILAKIMLPTIEVAVRTAVAEVFKQQQIKDNNNQNNPQTLWGQPPFGVGTTPSPDFFLKLSNQNVLDRELIERKSKSAVIEKLPQLASEAEEQERIKSIVTECNLLEKLDPSSPPHRHPLFTRQQPNNSRPKITKVFFVDKNSRDLFLQRFYNAKRKIQSIPSYVFCRRDLTPFELDYLYKLRKHAYNANKACGLFKYVVRDLQIIEISNPKPLRAQNN